MELSESFMGLREACVKAADIAYKLFFLLDRKEGRENAAA